MKPIYTLPYSEIKGFLSHTQLSEHYKLYEGYYNQARDLPAKINGTGDSENWLAIRGMQKTLQYALSGRELHEVYFDSISIEKTDFTKDASKLFQEKIVGCFTSLTTFLSDVMAAAKVSRGWYRLEFDPANHMLYHNVGDFHDEGSTPGFYPIIALDMYDHAYFYDYQTNKGEYIKKFLEHLDWKKVSKKFETLSR